MYAWRGKWRNRDEPSECGAQCAVPLPDGLRHSLAKLRPIAARWQSELRDAGARELFFVLSLSDLPRWGPFAVIPAADEDSRNRLESVGNAMIAEFDGLSCMSFEGGVFIGKAAAWRRIERQELPVRSDTVSLLAAGREFPASLVVCPSEEIRRAVHEIAPQFPATTYGMDVDTVLDGARMTLAILDLSEPPVVELKVIGEGSIANGRVVAKLGDFLDRVLADVSFGLSSQQTTAFRSIVEIWKILASDVRIDEAGSEFSVRLTASDPKVESIARQLKQVESASRAIAIKGQMREIALSMHNYHDATKAFPPYAATDEAGRPFLSWRVLVLPYLLEDQRLYKRFRLDEPWDSEHNRALIAEIPSIYVTDGDLAANGKTVFVMPRGEQFIGRIPPMSLRQVTDGTSQTILLAEVAPEHAVIWTKPDDWEVDLANLHRGLFGAAGQERQVTFVDASASVLTAEISGTLLKAMLTPDGGESIDVGCPVNDR